MDRLAEMKYIFSILLSIGFVGCGKKSENSADGQTVPGGNQSANNAKRGTPNKQAQSPKTGDDKLLKRLPEAGSWVLHKFALNVDAKGVNGEEVKLNVGGSLKVSLLETKVIKGKRCRPIETEIVIQIEKSNLPNGDQEQFQQMREKLKDMKTIIQFLFDEIGLESHENPLKSLVAIKVGMGMQNGKVEVKEIPGVRDFLGLVAPETKNKAKKLEEKEVATKLGKLICSGDMRRVELKTEVVDELAITLEVRRHESVPFGMVSTLATLKGKDGETLATLTLTVQEVGKGAVSQLPKPE